MRTIFVTLAALQSQQKENFTDSNVIPQFINKAYAIYQLRSSNITTLLQPNQIFYTQCNDVAFENCLSFSLHLRLQ